MWSDQAVDAQDQELILLYICLHVLYIILYQLSVYMCDL